MSKRRLAIFIGPIVLLIAAGSAFFGWQRFASEVSTATLYKGKGDVLYKLPNKPYVLLEDKKVELVNLSSVKTDSGTATVVFPDGSMISVGEHTEIQITIKDNVTTILQKMGNTYHRIKKLFGGKEYQVQTPTALAVVRGTKFGVTIQDGTSVVFVTESQVEVENKVTKQLVKSDQEAVIEGDDEPITVIQMSEDFKKSQWYQQNVEIDEDFDPNVKKQDKNQTKIDQVVDNVTKKSKTATKETKKNFDNVKNKVKQDLQQIVASPIPTVPAEVRTEAPSATQTPLPTTSPRQSVGNTVNNVVDNTVSTVNEVVNQVVPTVPILKNVGNGLKKLLK